MLGHGTRRVCRKLIAVSGVSRRQRNLTKQQLILIHDVCGPEVQGSENQDQRLVDAVQQGDHKDKDGLGVNSAVIDHRWCI
jgi:hypothetical protein